MHTNIPIITSVLCSQLIAIWNTPYIQCARIVLCNDISQGFYIHIKSRG